MDDQRTRDELDALADLFLTGTMPNDNAAGRSTPHASTGPAAATAEPPLRRPASDVLNELDGPEPFQLPVKHEEDGDPETAAFGLSGNACVEAVFLGNLPGFAGPWLSQYAHDLAQRLGPVGLLRIDDERVELEVMPGGAAEGEDTNSDLPDASEVAWPNGTSLVDRVFALAASDSTPVNRWLVLLPSDPSDAVFELARHIDDWTFLFGADDMAVRAASRMIEPLVLKDAEPHRLGAVVMGSDAAVSRDAVDRLNRALDASLDVEVELIDWRQRMRPVQVTRIGGADRTAELSEQLIEFLECFETDTAEPRATRPIPPNDVAPATVDDVDEESIDDTPIHAPTPTEDKPMSTTATLPAPTLTEDTPVASSRVDETPVPPVELAATPSESTPAPSDDARQDGPFDLARFLTDNGASGVVRLEARCPDHAAAQIVLDQAGRLHLLVRHEAQPGDSPSMRAAMVDLLETRAWVERHIDLLQLTQRQLRFDLNAAVQLHLFTAEAKSAVSLIGRLGHDLKLHLLKEVRVGDRTTWFSTELN